MAKSRKKTSHRTMWTVIVYAMLAVACVLMIVVAGGSAAAWAPSVLLAGLLGLVVSTAAAPIALLLGADRGDGGRARETERQLVDLARGIHEHTMISDNTKRVLFRENELELLRRTIEDDIARGQYDAGLELCGQMADLFGYRHEAEEFRERILQCRDEQYDAEVNTAIDELDAVLEQRDWSRAYELAARVRRLYPDSHLIQRVPQSIEQAREAAKAELERELFDAAAKEDVERAMEVLKELDRYLSREEAAKLAEVASGVVVKHRENLGVQFRLAVNDHRWAEAARIGETIIVEFPNTKMAEEVRSMIEVLRTRATQAAVAAAADR